MTLGNTDLIMYCKDTQCSKPQWAIKTLYTLYCALQTQYHIIMICHQQIYFGTVALCWNTFNESCEYYNPYWSCALDEHSTATKAWTEAKIYNAHEPAKFAAHFYADAVTGVVNPYILTIAQKNNW